MDIRTGPSLPIIESPSTFMNSGRAREMRFPLPAILIVRRRSLKVSAAPPGNSAMMEKMPTSPRNPAGFLATGRGFTVTVTVSKSTRRVVGTTKGKKEPGSASATVTLIVPPPTQSARSPGYGGERRHVRPDIVAAGGPYASSGGLRRPV